MERRIVSFTRDDTGHLVAHLDCLHRQNVQDSPPLVGTSLDCPLCERAELPTDLERVRVTVTWTEATLPQPLRRHHRVASGVWGLLHVSSGAVRFRASTTPLIDRVVPAGAEQPIPPDVDHSVEPVGRSSCHVEFLRRRSERSS